MSRHTFWYAFLHTGLGWMCVLWPSWTAVKSTGHGDDGNERMWAKIRCSVDWTNPANGKLHLAFDGERKTCLCLALLWFSVIPTTLVFWVVNSGDTPHTHTCYLLCVWICLRLNSKQFMVFGNLRARTVSFDQIRFWADLYVYINSLWFIKCWVAVEYRRPNDSVIYRV